MRQLRSHVTISLRTSALALWSNAFRVVLVHGGASQTLEDFGHSLKLGQHVACAGLGSSPAHLRFGVGALILFAEL